ncbi:MAG: FAD-dependent oxidoreductase, partial [Candidatus Bathyarchaeia archaeon]
GYVPITEIVKKAGVEVDERGCIKVNREQKTNLEGVYAAGDCTCGGMQIITAAGEGARAVISASRLIRK